MEAPLLRRRAEPRRALWLGASALCALALVSVLHSAQQATVLAGAPYGGYWGGYYDAGYYGAYNNPYAYDVARQDYWNAMNAYDAAGVWSYNDWVEQRRDWDRAGYGYGPYDSEAHAAYWRSADQNGWADQTRYNNYLSAYNAEAGGEYPYGYPSIEDNYEWQGGGYPSIADNWEQRGGMYRRASDMKDSNHQGEGLRATESKQTAAKEARMSSLAQQSKHAKKRWQPMKYKQIATVNLKKKAPTDNKLVDAKEAYRRAASTFRHAYPGATYQQWLEATSKWDSFFVKDRMLDTEQVQLDDRKAAALKSVLPPPAFPALRQLDTAEEERVRVRTWTPALHFAPMCKATQLAARGRKKRWQDTPACQLCRDEGSDCDKCAANAKQMLCEFVSMPKPVPKSELHFTPEGATDVHMPKRFSFASSRAEHGTQLSEIKAAAREQRDLAAEKSEEKAAKDYAVVDATLAPLNRLQAQLNQARIDLYMSEFGEQALRLLNGPAFSAKLPQLMQAEPGYLRWRDEASAPRMQQQQQGRAAAAKAATQILSQSGDSKLMRLGVNLGGNPLLPSRVVTKAKRVAGKHSKLTKLYPATEGTDHYSAPGAFHANCEGNSPTALCDQGVWVGEQEQTHAQDVAIDAEKMEGSYNTGVSPVREMTPNTIGGDFFGHAGAAPMTREQVQELTR